MGCVFVSRPSPRALGRIAALLGALLLAPGAVPVASAAPDSGASPPAVPSVRQWTAGGAGYRLGAAPRIVAAEAEASDARTFAADLSAMTGVAAAVGTGPAGPGDISLRVAPRPGDRPESYRIDAGPVLAITAADREGLVHATQTAEQWLRQSRTLAGGVARDWPDYPIRGAMFDTGREFMCSHIATGTPVAMNTSACPRCIPSWTRRPSAGSARAQPNTTST